MTSDHVKAQEANEVGKKTYEKPTLEKLGNVVELTQGVLTPGTDNTLVGSV